MSGEWGRAGGGCEGEDEEEDGGMPWAPGQFLMGWGVSGGVSFLLLKVTIYLISERVKLVFITFVGLPNCLMYFD